ncbi:hemagglutinin repeat-containing protein, partial [Pasteurella atlantica]|uniref:hemagglutinin repeat-containing protein n=5 Tax=Pasteurellales TaxID=135625 RepID=UPI00275F05F4
NITGSNILSDDGTSVEAGGKVTIEAAKNYSRHNDFKQTKKSGFTASLSGGVASIGYGKSRSSLDQKGASTSLTGSIINSRNGNNTVIAGDDLNLIASKVSAGGDVSLRGKNVNLLTGAEENTLNMKAHSKSSGFSVGLTYSPAMAFVNAYNENRKSGSFSDSTVGKVMQQGTGLLKAGMAAATPVVVTAGHHKSSAYKNTNVSDGLSSEVNAGGKLTVVATEGSITSLGSSLSAGSDALLSAYKDITLGFARSSTNQTADNKKSGFSVDNRNWISPAGIYRDKGDGQGQLDSATGTVLSVGGKSTLQTQTGDIDIVGSSVVSEGDNIINAAGDVNIVSTQNSKSQSESHKSKGIGSAQISDTERFDGYMSGRSNASDQSVEQVRSLVGSEAGNVHIQAGGHYRQQVADVLADKDISVRAKSINILEDMNSGNSHQSSKDLKIGQFTKVSSPLIDLVNAVDEARKSKANDRVKSLQGLAVASRGYQAYDTVKNGGALVKVETGVGFKTAKSQQDSQYALSQSNKLNAGGNVSLTSTEGNIHLQNTNVNAGNLIALDSAKEILLESGQSHKKADGSNSSAGLSVGVGASVGAQTGVYVYGEAGWSQGENHLDSNTHRNTTLTSDKLSLTSKGNTTLRGATAKANRIDADIGGELTIESPQDVVKQSSEQTGVGARVQLSLGTAWEVSGNASHSEGKSNHQQVNEQSGLFAGDGGYHVTAENVDLKGGAIASTNAKNSELITNKITFSDVQNQSESSAVSASLSGKTGENENGQDITSVSPSLPMKNGNNDSSVTRATLTEGKITLNKDTNPTQTTAKALGINTELTNANVQTETPNDVGEMLKEQSTINSAIGDVSSAVNTYTQSKQKEVAEKLKTAKTPQEVAEIKAEVESWGVGGSNKRAVDTVTTLLTTALAGKSPTEVAAATASPYLNETIHKATEGNKTANLLAHAVLSAVEFKVAGLDPTVGALSGVAGEGTAMVLAEKVFNKPANQLTPKEKNILITASTLAGSLAGATGGSVEGANAGGVSAKTAVENNNLATTMAKRSYPVIRKVICSQKCQEAIIGLGIGSAIVLSSSEIEEAVSVAISQDPRKISNLTDLQRQYLNEQILNKKGIFIGNQQVWIPNTSGGFTPVDPELVVTTYGGKQIIDPRIFVDNTGGIQYPDDYEIPNNTAGDIDLNTLDVPNHTGGDQLVNKPDLPLALEKSNDEKYFTKPKTEEITGFENLVKARRKTLLQGGAGKRARWKDQDGNIYEWDSQHGALEKYNKRGKHLGEFDYKTGKQLKSADKKRRVEP